MRKYVLDLTVGSIEHLNDKYVHLKLRGDEPLPEMLPGQFVQVKVEHSPGTFLRRPISINFVDYEQNELWLLVAAIGDGTRAIASLQAGDRVNCILPLGNTFSVVPGGNNVMEESTPGKHLLVGGGVGIAPLLFQGKRIHEQGGEVVFLLGGRKSSDLLLLDEYAKYGRVMLTTEDGSKGEKGFVTNHSILQKETFDIIQCCGPKPMMQAMAAYCQKTSTECEVSLENLMACGLGACLCCVEKTTKGNVCVCTEGPVMNTKKLLWNN